MIYRLFLAILVSLPVWDLSAWQPVTQACSTVQGDTLVMECESAGLASVERYAGPIHVSVDVQAQAVGTTDRYWAGLALNSDVQADESYAEVALTQGIAPFEDVGQPSAVLLSTTGKDDCCQMLQPIDSAAWHTLTIDYANGRATYSVDGQARTVKVHLGPSYQVELLCVAVNPGESAPTARTRCQWRNLVITTAARPTRSAPQGLWQS